MLISYNAACTPKRYTRFHISNISELQSEDFAEVLVFIGKNSKEKVTC